MSVHNTTQLRARRPASARRDRYVAGLRQRRLHGVLRRDDAGHRRRAVHDRPLAGAELRRCSARSPARRRSSTTASTTALLAGRRCRVRSTRRSATRWSASTCRSHPADVTFPLGTAGQNDRVQVWVYRTKARGNEIPTLIGTVFGVSDFDITATATAEAAAANAMTCVKPFTIPDKWVENHTPPWTIDSTFDRYDNKGKIIANPDVYIPPSATHSTWTNADEGTPFILRAGRATTSSRPSTTRGRCPATPVATSTGTTSLPAIPTVIPMNSPMVQEPGNMVGPTIQGVAAAARPGPGRLLGRCDRVVSTFGKSPRMFPIPLYDPDVYQDGKQTAAARPGRHETGSGSSSRAITGNEVTWPHRADYRRHRRQRRTGARRRVPARHSIGEIEWRDSSE